MVVVCHLALVVGSNGVARRSLERGVVLFVGPRVLPGKKGAMSTPERNSNGPPLCACFLVTYSGAARSWELANQSLQGQIPSKSTSAEASR
jgi:hypothetical protein